MLLPLLFLWCTIGLAVGFMLSKIINLHGDDPKAGIILAALAATLAGLSYNLYSGHGFIGWNAWACLYAGVGGLLIAIVWHIVRSRYATHKPYTTRRSY